MELSALLAAAVEDACAGVMGLIRQRDARHQNPMGRAVTTAEIADALKRYGDLRALEGRWTEHCADWAAERGIDHDARSPHHGCPLEAEIRAIGGSE